MNFLRKKAYQLIPLKLRKRLGKSIFLRPLRNHFFRKNGTYIECKSRVVRKYLSYPVAFDFFASVQIAAKAEQKGMENTLLRNSIQLLETYKKTGNKSVVLDVGANFGYLSLVWAQSIASSGKIISFEPHPRIFESLSKSVTFNKLQAIIAPRNMAIGNRKGMVELSTTTATSNTIPINGSTKMRQQVNIPITTLDHIMEEDQLCGCDLIKIDVDGIEFEILEGAVQLIKKYKPIVIVETNGDHRLVKHMEALDYIALDQFLTAFSSEKKLPPNAYFVPKSLFDHAF